jgi:hypothetical protein
MFPFWKQQSCGDYLHENALLDKKNGMIFVTEYKRLQFFHEKNAKIKSPKTERTYPLPNISTVEINGSDHFECKT